MGLTVVQEKRLRDFDGAIAAADRKLHREVQRFRAGGATWDQIGAALGVTKQAAYQRFGRHRQSRQ